MLLSFISQTISVCLCVCVHQTDAPLGWRVSRFWGRGTWWSQMFPCSTLVCMCVLPIGPAPEWDVLHTDDSWYKVRPYRDILLKCSWAKHLTVYWKEMLSILIYTILYYTGPVELLTSHWFCIDFFAIISTSGEKMVIRYNISVASTDKAITSISKILRLWVQISQGQPFSEMYGYCSRHRNL